MISPSLKLEHKQHVFESFMCFLLYIILESFIKRKHGAMAPPPSSTLHKGNGTQAQPSDLETAC